MRYSQDFATLLEQYLSNSAGSTTWLAKRLGVNPGTVSRWRNGEALPNSAEVVLQIADVLGVKEHHERAKFVKAAGYFFSDGTINGERLVPQSEDLALLLEKHIQERFGSKGSQLLARVVNERFGEHLSFEFISRNTIDNWRRGAAKTVREWEKLAAVAVALGLNEDEADQLLHAAGQVSIAEKRMSAESKIEKEILAFWETPSQSDDDTAASTMLSNTISIRPLPFWRLESFFRRDNSDAPPFPPYITIMFEFSYFKLFTTFYEPEFSKIVTIAGIGSLVMVILRFIGIYHFEGYQLFSILLAVISIFILKQYLRRYFL